MTPETHREQAYAAGPTDPPVLDMTVGDLLRRAVAVAPDRTAVDGVAGPDRRAARQMGGGNAETQ